MPAVRQNRSKLVDTSSQALPTAPISVRGKAIDGVLNLVMALLSFRGISTPSLTAQGEQRRSSYFNIPRDNPRHHSEAAKHHETAQHEKAAPQAHIARAHATHA